MPSRAIDDNIVDWRLGKAQPPNGDATAPKCKIIQARQAIQAEKVRIGAARFWRASVIVALRLFPALDRV
jgi:hypothetical protein